MRKSSRIKSALETLDNIIRTLSLSFIDQHSSPESLKGSNLLGNPNSTSRVLPSPLYNRSAMSSTLPAIRHSSQLLQYRSEYTPLQAIVTDNGNQIVSQGTCRCNELCLGYGWKEAKTLVPFWLCTPMWSPTWTEAEIRREECRRLCWNTLLLFASYTSYCAGLGIGVLDLFLLRPSNVSGSTASLFQLWADDSLVSQPLPWREPP